MSYPFFSCTSPSDDPFRACFGCENDKTKRNSKHPRFLNFIDRQSGEVFQATSQNRRVICGKDPLGNMRCRLRIDRAMQLRRVSYGRALQFIQSEQYLGDKRNTYRQNRLRQDTRLNSTLEYSPSNSILKCYGLWKTQWWEHRQWWGQQGSNC